MAYQFFEALADSAMAMSPNTPLQSSKVCWRNNRIAGNQGLSGRFSIRRQLGTCFSPTQTGRPNAPARWAIKVPDLTIKSRLAITAAVSTKASNNLSIPLVQNIRQALPFRIKQPDHPIFITDRLSSAFFEIGSSVIQLAEYFEGLAANPRGDI